MKEKRYNNKTKMKKQPITTLLLTTSQKIIRNRSTLYNHMFNGIKKFLLHDGEKSYNAEKSYFTLAKPSGNMIFFWGGDISSYFPDHHAINVY